MKKAHLLVLCACFMAVAPAMAAVSIKKAAPVATKQSTAIDGAGSLVGTALTLVAGVRDLNKQVNDMDAECRPTSAEITFVNNMVKEWAKTGAASDEDVQRSLSRRPCDNSTGIGGYQTSVEIAAMMDGADICYDTFRNESDKDMVWYNFPRVGTATYCDDGSRTCGKDQKYASDIYEIFNLIDFTEADYTPSEASVAAKIISKTEKCSSARLSQAKRALWGNFLTQSIGTLGQPTNTASIMDAVSGVVNNSGGSGLGGALGGLQSIGGFISSAMDK